MWSVPLFTFDTNIAIYAFSNDAAKSEIARSVIERSDFVGVQVLNEFANATFKKQRRPWAEIEAALGRLRQAVPKIQPIDESVHIDGLRIAQECRLSFYDSLILAAAMAGGARTFYSEDMQHGMTIFETVRIVNPFVPGALES